MAETQQSASGRMKRRGILAAAGAVVAGIAAKQTAQPVAAAANMQFADTSAMVINTAHGQTTLQAASGSTSAILFLADARPVSGPADAIDGYASGTGFGVYGYSPRSYGVYGSTAAAAGSQQAGVYGTANGRGTYGVLGEGLGAGIGVQGQDGSIGVSGTVSAPNAIGVSGASMSGSGVVGSTTSNTPGTAGGYFYTTTSGGSGVVGQVFASSGAAAFVGAAAAPNYAGFFTGPVVINGKLVVTDPSYKSGALLHPDGTHRLVYCVESPESWIEDVGTGTLSSGKATITFDNDFTAVTHTDTYHVFLTEMDGTHHHLSVEKQTPTGFTVTADSEIAKLKGKQANDLAGTFSWKVMVKAKSSVKSERLEKFTMPSIKLADKPPDVPNLPTVPVPPKKP